jgi:hypothetical protein
MPEDGRDWENAQMRAQREAFVRDSIRRERTQGRAQQTATNDER